MGAKTSVAGHENARRRLAPLVERAALLLPAQGPISVFIHHNTLHALEDMSFEEGVAVAAERLGAEPYLAEEGYRAALASGRITDDDVDAVIAGRLGAAAAEPCAGGLCRRGELWRALLRFGVDEATGAELAWVLAETGARVRLRRGLSEAIRRRWLDRAGARLGRDRPRRESEAIVVGELWEACVDGARRTRGRPPPPPPSIGLGERLRLVCGADPAALVRPRMIRLVAAFLDQGIAHWPLPGRERGLWRCGLAVMGAARGAPWLAELRRLAAAASTAEEGPWESLEASLEALGASDEASAAELLSATALALRGWAGMIRQLEVRPDRAPVRAPSVSLVEHLALHLLHERAAIAALAREHLGHRGSLPGLAAALAGAAADGPEAGAEAAIEARAFVLFQVAQALVIEADAIARRSDDELQALVDEIAALPGLRRRELLHAAYEGRHRREILGAIAGHAASGGAGRPAAAVQAVFCIDEREESLRRHLEEVDPGVETFGVAGFFGVAMYYRGAEDALPAPLCPIAVRPRHEVHEVVAAGVARQARRRAGARWLVARLRRGFDVGSRTFARGTLLTATLGALAVAPLVLRVLFPRFASRLRRRGGGLWRAPAATRLALERREGAPTILGEVAGFTVDEMAVIVARLLEESGLGRALAPLVLIVGHGSESQGNPHASAYECGACGGGRGGPNARAFAQMANDPRVRERLAADGVVIPAATIFVGGLHNTCDEGLGFADVDRVPASHQPLLQRAQRSLAAARARNAHERCRRFESAPPWLSPALALTHVEARAQDLAQVRPELGHATNAICVVGRRDRTRGLFLDRRAFLVSYDPRGDDDGAILGRVVDAALPVCAGINLEYYFSRVDPTGHGAGSKLPHNIAGLLGVMDGHQSDLRTGLPWQMVELHEPMRLLVIVEAEPAAIEAVLARSPAIRRLVDGRWIALAALDPRGAGLLLREDGVYRAHEPNAPLPVVRSSAEWYRGRRDHLPCARIDVGGPG